MADLSGEHMDTNSESDEWEDAESEEGSENMEDIDAGNNEEGDIAALSDEERKAMALEAKNRGNELYKSQSYHSAIDAYSRAIELDPEEPAYYYNRAAANIMIRGYDSALDDAKKAISIDPSVAKYHLRAAKCYLSLGRQSDALRNYNRVLELDPQNRTALQEVQHLTQVDRLKDQAKDAFETGHYNNCVSSVDRALALSPSSDVLLLLKAEALLKLGRSGESDRITMGMLRENKNNTGALHMRGLSLYNTGDLEKAQLHFKQALRGDPDYARSRQMLKVVKDVVRAKQQGNDAFKSGDYKVAVEFYSTGLDLAKDNDPFCAKLHYNRALCLSRQGEVDAAIDDCQRVLELDESHAKARLKLASLYMDSERYEDAIKIYKDALEQDSSNRDLRQKLKNAELELKKSKRKDYYKILGITDKSANERDIKKAYRKSAMAVHPDRVQGEEAKADAEVKFKEVGEAYAILSDPQKKARYDRGDDLEDIQGGGGMPGGFDPSDLFAQMFAGGGGGGFGGGHSHGGGCGFHFG